LKRWLGAVAAGLVLWLAAVGTWIAIGPAVPDDSHAATAIVLGAAVNGDTPSPVFAARIDHAIALYRADRVERILITGGQSPEDSLSEAASGAVYAQARGVPAEAILLEGRSRTTRQNIDNAKAMIGPAGSEPVLIVSDPLHMRRAMAMACAAGLNAQPSPTPSSRYRSLGTRLPFLAREVWFIHLHWLMGI
jgi:uncharacterized SAM-binding protein YcdF (DUF218 family)